MSFVASPAKLCGGVGKSPPPSFEAWASFSGSERGAGDSGEFPFLLLLPWKCSCKTGILLFLICVVRAPHNFFMLDTGYNSQKRYSSEAVRRKC